MALGLAFSAESPVSIRERFPPDIRTLLIGGAHLRHLDRRQRVGQMDIREDDLSSAATQSLLRLHLAGMHTNSPPGHVFALDLSGLKAPDVTVWSAWKDNEICGIAALRQLDASSGEVKSMRTHPDHLRRGVAAALLERIIHEARARGLRR